MFPVALAIGAGISALSSIAGGVSANKRRKKADQILEDRRRRLDEWYQSEMNQPYLDLRIVLVELAGSGDFRFIRRFALDGACIER